MSEKEQARRLISRVNVLGMRGNERLPVFRHDQPAVVRSPSNQVEIWSPLWRRMRPANINEVNRGNTPSRIMLQQRPNERPATRILVEHVFQLHIEAMQRPEDRSAALTAPPKLFQRRAGIRMLERILLGNSGFLREVLAHRNWIPRAELKHVGNRLDGN